MCNHKNIIFLDYLVSTDLGRYQDLVCLDCMKVIKVYHHQYEQFLMDKERYEKENILGPCPNCGGVSNSVYCDYCSQPVIKMNNNLDLKFYHIKALRKKGIIDDPEKNWSKRKKKRIANKRKMESLRRIYVAEKGEDI